MSYFKFLSLLLFLGCTGELLAQQIYIGDEETDRKLKWSDFRGPVDQSSPHYAMTTWLMEYSMDEIRTYGDSVHIGKLVVKVKMEPNKSWCIQNKTTDELLKHEQGHFDIAILCMKEFMSIYRQTTFHRSDLDRKMKKIFSDMMNKYHQLGIDYDRETEHSQNTEAQKHWNLFFAKYL
jgi:hypothetical protein